MEVTPHSSQRIINSNYLTYTSGYFDKEEDSKEINFQNVEPRKMLKYIDGILDHIDIKNVNSNNENTKKTISDSKIFKQLFEKIVNKQIESKSIYDIFL